MGTRWKMDTAAEMDTTWDLPTLWNGHRRDELEMVGTDIPSQGACPKNRPALENWRQFSNCYYRLYNDGDTPHHGRMTKLAKLAGHHYYHRYHVRNIEEIGNLLLDAALAERNGS